MKRWLAAALCALLILAAGGCAKKSQSAEPTPEPTRDPSKDIEISLGLWGVSDGLNDPSTQWLLEQIFQRFGVRFTLVDISALSADSMQLGQSELPQVMTHPLYEDRFSYTQILNMGLVRSIPAKLYEKYPAIKSAVSLAQNAAGDAGTTYYIPRTSYAHESAAASASAIFVRTDWASTLGHSIQGSPSWEEMISLLKDYTYSDIDGNGKADTWGMTTSGSGLGGIGRLFFDSYGVRDWVLENGQWIPGYLSTQGKEALKWANYAYRMGFIDTGYGSMTTEDAIAKFCAGRAGALVMDATPYNVSLLEAKWAELQPEVALSNAVGLMDQPVTTYGVSYQELDEFSGGTMFRKDVDDKTVERVLQVMEWLSGTEGLSVAMYGEQGTDYTMGESGPVSQVKDGEGRSISFLEQNSALRALAQLATYAKDGANPDWRTAYQTTCLETLRASWWKNAWKKPMFTDYMTSMTMATYNPGDMLGGEVAKMMISSADIDAQWEDFKARMAEYVVIAPAQEEVNAYAQAHGITAEE
ncbi:MAG: hypothetical protein PHD32_11920 [Eubacteriales bacterium]|nr:hypothetical protein [Eubacteriales bacterium]